MNIISSRSTRLTVMLLLTGSYFFVELIIGYMSNSLALISDSFHMLSDILSLAVGLFAIRLTKKSMDKISNNNWSYGWARAEILGALVNSVFLLALCFTILIDAIQRFITLEKVNNPKQVLIVGGIGLALNLIGLFLFHDHGHAHHHDHDHNHQQQAIDFPDMGKDAPLIHNNHPYVSSTSMGVNDTMMSEIAIGTNRDHVRVVRQGARVEIIETNSMTRSISHTIPIEDQSNLDANDNITIRSIENQHKGEYNKHSEHHHSSHHHDLNLRGVFLHVLGDALGSVAVMISGGIILALQDPITLQVPIWSLYIDPIISIIISGLLIIVSVPLLRSAASVVLQGVPSYVDINELKNLLIQVPGVVDVHELHVWQLDSIKAIASLHVTLDLTKECHQQQLKSIINNTIDDYDHHSSDHYNNSVITQSIHYHTIASRIKYLLHVRGVHSTTIQPEFVNPSDPISVSCMYQCPAACSKVQCCPDTNPKEK